MNAIRQNLDLAMARARMTPKELAEAAKMPHPTVNNVIAGRNVRPATLGRIAQALGVDPTELIERGG